VDVSAGATEHTDRGQNLVLTPLRGEGRPGWIDKLWVGLVIYVAICATGMLTGFGGDRVRNYVGLLADAPASLAALIITITATRRMARGISRTAWACLSTAIALYLIGISIGIYTWLHDRDPFPGPSDVFYLAFYPFLGVAVALMIRAAAVKVRWTQFTIDATILVVGFGAFFWFLIIHPAASSGEVDVLKNALSQTYIALSCILVLALGVLLLAGAGNAVGRRVPLLLSVGFATMFLGDILWSVAKIGGNYLSGDLQDVLYLACYVPIAAAGRDGACLPTSTTGGHSMLLAQSLPASMLAAFPVLVSFTRGDIGAREVMTIWFGLALP
jgi:hypothetical protein